MGRVKGKGSFSFSNMLLMRGLKMKASNWASFTWIGLEELVTLHLGLGSS